MLIIYTNNLFKKKKKNRRARGQRKLAWEKVKVDCPNPRPEKVLQKLKICTLTNLIIWLYLERLSKRKTVSISIMQNDRSIQIWHILNAIRILFNNNCMAISWSLKTKTNSYIKELKIDTRTERIPGLKSINNSKS